MDADGSGVRELTSTGDSAREPAWSPDGSEIAFTAEAAGLTQVFLMNSDGSDTRQLTTIRNGAFCPSWSPDGRELVVSASDGSSGYQLWVLDVRTSAMRLVAQLPGAASDPAWSPDGSSVAFAWWTPTGNAIYSIHPDGTGLTRLSPDPVGGQSPTWSPDGRWVAFAGQTPDGTSGIFLVRSDGTDLGLAGRTARVGRHGCRTSGSRLGGRRPGVSAVGPHHGTGGGAPCRTPHGRSRLPRVRGDPAGAIHGELGSARRPPSDFQTTGKGGAGAATGARISSDHKGRAARQGSAPDPAP